MGSDNGCVRIPGAFCGVVGFKTSYGRVSTRGVVPSAYSMDTIGPIARTVEDAAAILQVIAGYDPRDAITLSVPVPDYFQALRAPIANLRMSVPRDYFFEGLHPDVSSAVEEAIRHLKGQVREVRDVTLPRLQVAVYHPWSQRQMRELMQVQTVPYVETLKRIRECRRDIRRIFQQVDILALHQ